MAIYNANGNSHKYSGRGFNGLRYIPDTYAGNDACMQPVERRGEIIFFFHSFPLSSSPHPPVAFSLCRERGSNRETASSSSSSSSFNLPRWPRVFRLVSANFDRKPNVENRCSSIIDRSRDFFFQFLAKI